MRVARSEPMACMRHLQVVRMLSRVLLVQESAHGLPGTKQRLTCTVNENHEPVWSLKDWLMVPVQAF